MIDIGQRMRELIPILHQGVNGIDLPDVKPECEDEWGTDYAIVYDVYHDQEDHYFDVPEFYWDLNKLLLKHFTADGERTVLESDARSKHPAGTIVVYFDEFRSAKEIEVYRAKEQP